MCSSEFVAYDVIYVGQVACLHEDIYREGCQGINPDIARAETL